MSRTTTLIRQLCPPAARSAMSFAVALGLFLAVVAGQAHAAGPTPQLPDLVAAPPDHVSFETSFTEGGLRERGEAKLLLRFAGYVHNIGPGALDFRGSRKTPSEPMHAFQRIYNSDGSFKEEPSSAELIYVTADSHEHWHLQRVAKYSLWNSEKTAEATPAQKVGFCLEDSEHVEPNVGPANPVYADNVPPGRKFCMHGEPEALSLYEGISPGWRDLYAPDLTLQWVDASNVVPGEYWLREDVNPNGVIKEVAGAKAPAYATQSTIIPGFDALAQATSTRTGEAKTLTLTSKAWSDSATPHYTIVSGPQHGTLEAGASNQVIYKPAPGYSGSDSFTFSASDPNSPFPLHPSGASISIEVGQPPVVANAAQSNRTWREGRRLASYSRTHKRAPIGTIFSFTLNEPANVSFAFTQQVRGRKVNGKCLAQTGKNRRKSACKRTVTRGTLSFTGHAGRNNVAFQGRFSRSGKLKPGSYTLVITATNASRHSSPRRLSFTIVK